MIQQIKFFCPYCKTEEYYAFDKDRIVIILCRHCESKYLVEKEGSEYNIYIKYILSGYES
jgi:hypothetical protein